MTSHWATVTLTVPSDLAVFDPATVAFTVIEYVAEPPPLPPPLLPPHDTNRNASVTSVSPSRRRPANDRLFVVSPRNIPNGIMSASTKDEAVWAAALAALLELIVALVV